MGVTDRASPETFPYSDTLESIPMITGGMYARPHEFPYQINLQYEDDFTCSGSILSTLFILTAAHCVINRSSSSLKVVAGDHHRFIDEQTEQIRSVAQIFIHPNYDDDTIDSDIAILALSEPLIFNEYVKNISYPTHEMEFKGMGTVAGWGQISPNTYESDVLLKVKLPIIPKTECRRKFYYVTENMICAGGLTHYKGDCPGDSGGPLVCKVGSKMLICGIVSFGYNACGKSGSPNVYTDVSRFSGWIDKTTQKYRLLRVKCKRSLFYCPDDDSCISRNKICDEKRDCSDGLDEKTCVEPFIESPATHFRCNNGDSIIADFVCDGDDDCRDNSDEDKCDFRGLNGKCNADEITCKKDGRCIPSSCKCDDQLDCDDGSDEFDCDNIFSPNLPPESTTVLPPPTPMTTTVPESIVLECNEVELYRCSLKECISIFMRCDGKKDCKNGEDELNCFNATVAPTLSTTISPILTTCLYDQFNCPGTNRCIPKNYVCDFEEDCPDGLDEVDCDVN